MLILSRRESECIHLGDDIVLTIVRVAGEKVRIGVEAPPHIKILRNELEISGTVTSQSCEPTDKTEPTPTPVNPQAAVAVVPISSSVPLTTPSVVRKVPIQIKRAA
jgi:carbon storage regulator